MLFRPHTEKEKEQEAVVMAWISGIGIIVFIIGMIYVVATKDPDAPRSKPETDIQAIKRMRQDRHDYEKEQRRIQQYIERETRPVD